MRRFFKFSKYAFTCLLFTSIAVLPSASPAEELHAIKLQAPPAADDQIYLGIGNGPFTLADVQADIIIIELFSLYCAMCSKEAGNAADLYRLVEQQATRDKKIKLLGIGSGNSADEVASFKQKNRVPFPLVPDQGALVMRTLKMPITPGFVALGKLKNGSFAKLHSRAGVLGPPQRFLDSVLSAAASMPGRAGE